MKKTSQSMSIVKPLILTLCSLIVAPPWTTSADNESPQQSGQTVNLLQGEDAWQSPDKTRWQFENGKLRGKTVTFPEVPTDDPEVNSFLTSKNTFEGDQLCLATDMVFERSRYLGVYIDYDPETDTGIWMATGHPVTQEEIDAYHKVPMVYIKTVDNGYWTPRAFGELIYEPGELVKLRWVKDGLDYQVWQDNRLLATYRPKKKYEAGHVRLRLMSAVIEFQKLEMTSQRVK